VCVFLGLRGNKCAPCAKKGKEKRREVKYLPFVVVCFFFKVRI